MCVTCGCDSSLTTDEVNNDSEKNKPYIIHHHYYHQGDVHHHYHYQINNDGESTDNHHHEHNQKRPHKHSDHHQNEHIHHSSTNTQSSTNRTERLVEIERHVLAKNDTIAKHNSEHFIEKNMLALNLMSSPGSGKTTLLVETINSISSKIPCAVIEGDQQTSNDADRIKKTGAPVVQINTGKGCHLDAEMVHQVMHQLSLVNNSILFIENVGNLVCPASFNLGENKKVVVISVTEGDDKPLKYPHIFFTADLMIINKIDLIPYVDFNINNCIANATQINPKLKTISLSCKTSQGFDEWIHWLEEQICV